MTGGLSGGVGVLREFSDVHDIAHNRIVCSYNATPPLPSAAASLSVVVQTARGTSAAATVRLRAFTACYRLRSAAPVRRAALDAAGRLRLQHAPEAVRLLPAGAAPECRAIRAVSLNGVPQLGLATDVALDSLTVPEAGPSEVRLDGGDLLVDRVELRPDASLTLVSGASGSRVNVTGPVALAENALLTVRAPATVSSRVAGAGAVRVRPGGTLTLRDAEVRAAVTLCGDECGGPTAARARRVLRPLTAAPLLQAPPRLEGYGVAGTSLALLEGTLALDLRDGPMRVGGDLALGPNVTLVFAGVQSGPAGAGGPWLHINGTVRRRGPAAEVQLRVEAEGALAEDVLLMSWASPDSVVAKEVWEHVCGCSWCLPPAREMGFVVFRGPLPDDPPGKRVRPGMRGPCLACCGGGAPCAVRAL